MTKAAKCDLCNKLYEIYDEKKLIKAKEKDMIFIKVLKNKPLFDSFAKEELDLCMICRSELLNKILTLLQ